MAEKRFEPNTFPMILHSHEQRRETSITNLPEEIIFQILVLLPAEILYNVVRYVCRQWYTMIEDPQFVTAHLPLSTSTVTVLMHSTYDSTRGVFNVYRMLDARECGAKLTDFKFELPNKVDLMSTCNGLLLMRLKRIFYVGNPITRRILALPKLSSFMSLIPFSCSLLFDSSSKVYKAVVAFRDKRIVPDLWGKGVGLAILTVGVDKAWRVLDLTYIKRKTNFSMGGETFRTTGFIYWHAPFQSHMFALDVKSESVKRIAVGHDRHPIQIFVPKGNFLTQVQFTQDLSMDVWVLKDNTDKWVRYHIGGDPIRNEWEKFLSLNKLERCRRDDYFTLVCPRNWLGNAEKILIGMGRHKQVENTNCNSVNSEYVHCIVYDLKTRTCSQVDTKYDEFRSFVPFVNSLAWV